MIRDPDHSYGTTAARVHGIKQRSSKCGKQPPPAIASDHASPCFTGIRALPTPPTEPQTAFASRRSPVRSRLAPLEKCLVIGLFWDLRQRRDTAEIKQRSSIAFRSGGPAGFPADAATGSLGARLGLFPLASVCDGPEPVPGRASR
jgi:hypothetical protein